MAREVDVDELGLAAVARRPVARELGLRAIGGILQAATGAQQVADAHAGLEWIVAARLHAAVDAHELARRSMRDWRRISSSSGLMTLARGPIRDRTR